jgi:hypothetical protein
MNKSATIFMDSLGDWKESINDIEPGGMVYISDYVEPLTHPQIENVLHYCQDRKISVSLATLGECFEQAPIAALYESVKYCIIVIDDHDLSRIEEFVARFKTTRGQRKYPMLGIRTYGKDENSRVFISVLRDWLLPKRADFVVNTFSRMLSLSANPNLGFKGIETLRAGPEVKIFTHSDLTQKFYSLAQEWTGLSWKASNHDRYNEDANAEEPGFAEF